MRALHREDALGVATAEAQGEAGGYILASGSEALSLFFFLPPSCGFMAYLPVADSHLVMRGDRWQISAETLTGALGGKGISSRASG